MQPQVLFFDQLNSTNDKVVELLAQGCAEGTTVVAGHQIHGRGQKDTAWESEAGKNILMSIALRPTFLQPEQMFYLSKAVSLSLVDFFQSQNITAQIKWPNDIYVGNDKICGILIEQKLSGNSIIQSIVGIGVNVNQIKFEYAPNPISLALIDGKIRNLEQIIENAIYCILNRYEKLRKVYLEKENQVRQDTLRAQIDSEYATLLYRKNMWSDYKSGETIFTARIVGVETNGQLILEHQNGTQQKFWFKEVSFVRGDR